MLIISSLDGAQAAFEAHRPEFVISLLAGDETVPAFSGLPAENHLSLCVETEACAKSIDMAAKKRAEELVSFGRAWNGRGDVLIHCSRGVSRSTAAAYVLMCMRARAGEEPALADALRRAAPHADPCPLLISYADDILERDGRMIDSIEDLPPPSPAISAPILTLPLAA